MANSPVMTRKDMREPDRFQVVAGQAATWLAARKKQASIVAAAAAAVILAVVIASAVQSHRAEAAGKAVNALLETVAAPVVAKAPDGGTTKTFATDEAKERAIAAEAEKVVATYGTGQPGLLAILVKADANYALKEWDAAAAEYERYLKAAPADDSLRFGALLGLGRVAEAKNDLAGAESAYERMAKGVPHYADRADLERARVFVALGKADLAKAILTKFAESHKDSSLTGTASQRLAQLGVK